VAVDLRELVEAMEYIAIDNDDRHDDERAFDGGAWETAGPRGLDSRGCYLFRGPVVHDIGHELLTILKRLMRRQSRAV